MAKDAFHNFIPDEFPDYEVDEYLNADDEAFSYDVPDGFSDDFTPVPPEDFIDAFPD